MKYRKAGLAALAALAALLVAVLPAAPAAAVVTPAPVGWMPYDSYRDTVYWCSGTQTLATGLYEQTCIYNAGTAEDPGSGRPSYWQSVTLFSATSGSHYIQVQTAKITVNTGTPNERSVVVGACGTRSISAGQRWLCITDVAKVNLAELDLKGSVRIGADGKVFTNETPVYPY